MSSHASWSARLEVPVVLTGGMSDPMRVRQAYARTGATAVMLARGCLGNPWLFEWLLGGRVDTHARRGADELDWVIDCAVEHLGVERAGRYLRKFYRGTSPGSGWSASTSGCCKKVCRRAPAWARRASCCAAGCKQARRRWPPSR